ncbi:hypothetical protein LDENG_00056120 [Lucifuga dentata]|nr:hypothetical protein LDENG_00056120 [Lucifuga dentata]
MTENTLQVKGKWELEMNIIMEDKNWEEVCLSCHKGINSHLWKEFDWKITMRFFRTPLIVSGFAKGTTSALCWRKCGMTGDYSHIFWDCQVLQVFWQDIKKEIGKILKIDIPLDPVFFFLLGEIHQDVLGKDQRYILRILLLVARKMITINWMKAFPPTQTQWTQRLKQVYIMEYMTAKLQMKMDTFVQR